MRMIKNSIYLAAALLLAGYLTVSCTKDPKDTPVDPKPEGTGYLSLNIPLEHAVRSRAGTTEYGHTAEYNINSIRIILYNAAGIAQHVESYAVEYRSDSKKLFFTNLDGTYIQTNAFPYIDGDANVVEVPDNRSELVIERLPFEVPVMDYQVVVLFNYLNFGKENGHAYVDGSQPANMWLYESTAEVGHNINILQTPMDMYQDWVLSNLPGNSHPYEYILNGINKITGLNAEKLGYMRWINESLNMFMSNADGVVRISATDLAASTDLTPVTATINVDRALAKVILKKGDGFGLNSVEGYTTPSGNGKVKDITWVPDVLNYRIYPMRQAAQTAPSNNYAEETPTTDRALRYAKDPNWDGYSNLRTTGSSNLVQNFAYMPQDPIEMFEIWSADPVDVFEKSWWDDNTNTINDYLWYYIPENTMQADEQWEDVTTSVVFRCQYIPTGWSESEVTANGYYYFQGYLLKHSQISQYLGDESKIPAAIADLKEVLAAWKSAGHFGGSNSAPTKAISEGGLNYYKDGINYYRIPIRHFNDTQSPGQMGYGRYGVLRNNVYSVVVEDILGPGSSLLPPPEGPDDKEQNLKVSISTKEWVYYNLQFDF